MLTVDGSHINDSNLVSDVIPMIIPSADKLTFINTNIGMYQIPMNKYY